MALSIVQRNKVKGNGQKLFGPALTVILITSVSEKLNNQCPF